MIFFSSWTLVHFYVFWRLTSIPFIVKRLSRKFIVTAGSFLWAIGILQRYVDEFGMEVLEQPLELFIMNWLGILFLTFFAFLVADIITLYGLLFRQYIVTIRTAALVAGILLSTIAFVQGMRPPVVNSLEVRIDGLPSAYDGLVIVAVSDMHLGAFIDGDWLRARVEQINALQPDLVLFLGDIFEGDYPLQNPGKIQQALRDLEPPLHVWAVTGNHEMHGGTEASIRFLEEADVHVLRDEWVEVSPGLSVGGVDDGGHRESVGGAASRITRVLESIPPETASIFLSHRPRMLEDASAAGVDLMLSGHTHGGQIWPFSYLVELANPLLEGRYEFAGMTAVVTRGAGTWGPRMRLWSPGEILRIELRHQSR